MPPPLKTAEHCNQMLEAKCGSIEKYEKNNTKTTHVAVQGQRREVLSEEEYSRTLSSVIQRNFFPDLPKLETQVALQKAREDGDWAKVTALRREARSLQELEEQSLERDADEEKELTEQGLRIKPRELEHETLTNFHIRVTSEDNAEYEITQREEIQQRKQERLRSTRDAIAPLTSAPSTNMNNNRTPLILASDEFNPSPHRHVLSRKETEIASQSNNPLFFVPNQSDSAEIEEPQRSSTTKLIHKMADPQHQSNNQQQPVRETNSESKVSDTTCLMPPPAKKLENKLMVQDSTISTTRMNTAIAALGDRNYENDKGSGTLMLPPVQYIPKDRFRKKIVTSATRFDNSSRPGQTSLAISYSKEKPDSLQDRISPDSESAASFSDYSTDATDTDLDSTPRYSIQKERELGRKRRRQEQNSFVAMTPVIIPGSQGSCGGDEPIITWGEVSSTPLVLSRDDKTTNTTGDVGGPIFNVAEETTREVAANRALATLHARGRRAAAASSSGPTLLGTTTTVAAERRSKDKSVQKQANTKVPIPARSSSAFGTALRASYAQPTRPASGRRHYSAKRKMSGSIQAQRTAHAATPQLLKPKSTV